MSILLSHYKLNIAGKVNKKLGKGSVRQLVSIDYMGTKRFAFLQSWINSTFLFSMRIHGRHNDTIVIAKPAKKNERGSSPKASN